MTEILKNIEEPNRQWRPESFVDEVCPEGRPTPKAWIEQLPDGTFACRDDDDPETWTIALTEGEVVEFVYCDSLPNFTVTFDAVGKTNYTEPPESANWFWDRNEHECCGDTISELITRAREMEAADTLEVGCCHWSGGEHLFRFTALGGPPRFVAVAPVTAEVL